GKVEDHGDAVRQESAHVWPEGLPQSGRAPDEVRYVDDLAGKEMVQELVLNDENGAFSVGQLFRQGGLSGRHLAAQKHQLRDAWPIRHSITRSALSSTECGMARPRALAVRRLITSSNFVGCSTGRSPGFAPFRILSTKVAARRKLPKTSTP